MKKTGAWLTVYALEQLPVKYTFGIPGVHNTEIYDELGKSKKINPILVTHEGGGAFMADAISRTSSEIGVLVTVPAAGITHAMSGIGEAYLDGIPMLVLSGGIRRDTGNRYQLHELDQVKLLAGITKKAYVIQRHNEIIPTIFEAYKEAISGEPGPVFIEIPVNIQLFEGEVGNINAYKPEAKLKLSVDPIKIKEATEMLMKANNPGMFLGWGCCDATESAVMIAELLQAPVATTLQGLSVFPGNHPLHTGMGFSKAAVPAAENAFKNCDCLLAVGTRFAEIPTGSFGAKVPKNLIHVDINRNVFHKNYPAKIVIEGDAKDVLEDILKEIQKKEPKKNGKLLQDQIARDKKNYKSEWKSHNTKSKVNPLHFFDSLRTNLSDDVITVVDDGNHTFLFAELFTNLKPRHYISPTDFNCMGYCVPAVIGAKLANPEKQVVGVVGDGAFLMTCMEILTASVHKLGVVYFVFNDGELSQISQGQEIPYNRKTCTILGNVNILGIAEATNSAYKEINNNKDLENIIPEALQISANGQPVIVNVNIDYSKRTRFTSGVVKTVLGKFPMEDKIRFVGRAVKRKITG
ncbi:MAG: thiamine pyrophosphate-binding protein [Leptospiraceae bacterium]|nr:thiamine pyrophosphate-binding protein [Leptospiraceae bacterium]MCP5495715.1 thiamine pyrophosphate-binding protein [Leptospiraceae bacterium]